MEKQKKKAKKARRKVIWTDEMRERARMRIHETKPWEKSTGPKTQEGKARSALNATKGGINRLLLAEYRAALHYHKKFMKQIRRATTLHLERDLFKNELRKRGKKLL